MPGRAFGYRIQNPVADLGGVVEQGLKFGPTLMAVLRVAAMRLLKPKRTGHSAGQIVGAFLRSTSSWRRAG